MNHRRTLLRDGNISAIPIAEIRNMYDAMFQVFTAILPDISEDLINDIERLSEAIRIRKKTVILDYGDVANHCFFATKGMVRALFLKKGSEQTCWFMGEGDIIIAVESFYSRMPSKERLIALEDTDCIALSWDDLEYIYQKHIEFNIIGRKLTEFYYRQAIERTKWVGLTAKERYSLLFREYPKFLNRVPFAALASYLGIDKATLSRIRKSIFKK